MFSRTDEISRGRYEIKAFVVFGTEKSFISLFIITPVSGTITCEPKKRFNVLVSDVVIPLASAVTRCDVPGLQQL